MLDRVIYISRAALDPCGLELRSLLEQGSLRNARLGVTGLLCYSGDHFAQVLEGVADALAALMGSIRADARHRILREWHGAAAADERWYPGWTLGYVFDERLEQEALGLLASGQPPTDLAVLHDRLFSNLELYSGPAARP